MSKEIKRLAEALAAKDAINSFLDNLKKLKADGSITKEQYTTAKAEYEQNLDAAKLETDRIKAELKKQLESIQQDIETYQFELGKLEAQYKVGELPLGKYQTSDRKLRAIIEQLESTAEDLSRLIAAKTSADISIPAKKRGIPTRGLPRAPKATPSARGGMSPKVRLIAIVAGVVVVAAVVVAVLLLRTSGVQEVKIPINIQGAANVGSLHLELAYDRQTMSATAVEDGTAVGDALFESNIAVPGDVVIGLVNNHGINGNGSVAIVTFQVTGKTKSATRLSLENVIAYDATSLDEIPASASPGSFTSKDGSFMPPTLIFGTE
jgi:hypothetical protein